MILAAAMIIFLGVLTGAIILHWAVAHPKTTIAVILLAALIAFVWARQRHYSDSTISEASPAELRVHVLAESDITDYAPPNCKNNMALPLDSEQQSSSCPLKIEAHTEVVLAGDKYQYKIVITLSNPLPDNGFVVAMFPPSLHDRFSGELRTSMTVSSSCKDAYGPSLQDMVALRAGSRSTCAYSMESSSLFQQDPLQHLNLSIVGEVQVLKRSQHLGRSFVGIHQAYFSNESPLNSAT